MGVVLWFVFVYLEIYNCVINGKYKIFMYLEDEKMFFDYNMWGVFGFVCVLEVLLYMLFLGIFYLVMLDLFNVVCVVL